LPSWMSTAMTTEGRCDRSLRCDREPLSLYVHIPFCRSKCPYCAFYSVVPGEGELDAYLEGLEGEVLLRWERIGAPIPLRSVYFGGGTPTILDAGRWERLVEMMESAFSFRATTEVTVEANPESLTGSHIRLWRDWRVSRVSLGVQSLDDAELCLLRRPHDSRLARGALAALAASGLSFSADLIFNLPGQTLRGWHRTLREVLSFGMEHLSLYELMIERESAWGRCPPPGMASGYPFYRWAQWYLASRGFFQYEIASFALNRRWSRHNLAYWTRSPVLGVGPGAWGFLGGKRYRNAADLRDYLRNVGKGKLPDVFSERLAPEESFREAAVLALRTAWGIPLRLFALRYGKEALRAVLASLETLPDSLFLRTKENVALSPRGMRVANAIWERLV